MTKELLLGIDIGTYSSKAALVTQSGEVLRSAVVPHGIDTPAPGPVEQDADGIWWHDTCALCRQLLGNPERTTTSSAEPSADVPHSLWNCPVCGGTMRVVERLSAAQLLLRSPPQPDERAA